MPDKQSTIKDVPSAEVDGTVKDFVIAGATVILCKKSSDDDTWIITAIIPK